MPRLIRLVLLVAWAFCARAPAQPFPPTAAETAFPEPEPMAAGPFQPTWESLENYQTPEWFRDAKFGIWAHWGPQGVPEMGGWYARFLYEPGNKRPWARDIYPFHAARYGHPSEFGFKDIIRTWEAERWEPEKLLALYRRAGARYFMALASHHDNFDLWNSKYQPWNAVRLGPHQDLIGRWATAARAAGLRFGVSVHSARAWNWYEPAQGADQAGPRAGVPYDGRLRLADGKGRWWEGLDPQDLYAQNHPPGARPDAPYITKFYNRTIDLINQYHPDLIYFDDTVLPFAQESDVGLKIAAHYYNADLARHAGSLEAVINGKMLDDRQQHALVLDIERGRSPGTLPLPWQMDTCIGSWDYDRTYYEQGRYKTATEVIQMLVDVVSKNGNLLLSIPLRGEGTPDPAELRLLAQLTAWMDVNQEAIFATRPWQVYGEGPSTVAVVDQGPFGGIKDTGEFTAADIRYTQAKSGDTLYATMLGWPSHGELTLAALAATGKPAPRGIASVTLLGSTAPLTFTRDRAGVHLQLPAGPPPPGLPAYVFRISWSH